MSRPIFFSYTDQDREKALRIANDLKAAGHEILTAQPIASFEARPLVEVSQEISRCHYFLLVMSSSSLTSEPILKQLTVASEESRQVVLLRFEDMDDMDIKGASINFRSHIETVERQEIDFTGDYGISFKELVQVLPKVLRARMTLGKQGNIGRQLLSMSVERRAYALTSLPKHLREAKRFIRLRSLLMSPIFLVEKVALVGAEALIEDYRLAVKAQSPTLKIAQLLIDSVPTEDHQLFLVWQALVQSKHLLDHCSNSHEITATLHGRLAHLLRLFGYADVEWELPTPIIVSRHAPPDLFDPTLERILLDRPASTAIVNGCAISADGMTAISASHDGTLIVWDTATGAERLMLRGHRSPIGNCAISADGTTVVSASYDGTLKLWDARTWRQRLTLAGHRGRVNGCAISADGKRIASVSHDGRVIVWNAERGSIQSELTQHTSPVIACDMSADGSLVVSASHDNSLIVWDWRDNTIKTLLGHKRTVHSCAISRDGDFIVSASWDGTLKVWDTSTGEVRKTLIGHTAFVTDCAISADGTHIISVSEDRTIKAWNLESGTCIATLHTDGPLNACAIALNSDDAANATEVVVAGNFGIYFLQFLR